VHATAPLAEQKVALSAADRVRFLKLLGGLRKQVDQSSGERDWGEVYELSLAHELTSYDARYLELSNRMNLPLASQDADLRAAARKAGVTLFE
jgi:predicted nucleic acid-binding protein